MELQIKDILDKIYEIYGYANEQAGPLSILNHTYEQSANHVLIDYILSETLVGIDGITRIGDNCPHSNCCYTFTPDDEDYDKNLLLNEERYTVRLWYYLVDNIDKEFKRFSSNTDLKYFFESGETYSKEDLEDKINEWWNEFLSTFDSYEILSEEDAEDIREICELDESDIYGIELNIVDYPLITLESLNSLWNKESYLLK
jgi:hypothetical protein